ncbi:hypothetical protein [Flavobacterium restrictum]
MKLEIKRGEWEVRSKKWKANKAFIAFYILCFMFFTLSSNAQCAMCRAALSGKDNQVKAAAVNDGIVYLMVIPYLLVGVLGYYIYRMKKNKN